jgi:hypothetical protein
MRGNSPSGTNGDGQLPAAILATAYDQGEGRSGVRWMVLKGDARAVLPELPESRFNCVVTSPPYFWQRDYEEDQQIGLEPMIGGYVSALADVMDQATIARTGHAVSGCGPWTSRASTSPARRLSGSPGEWRWR